MLQREEKVWTDNFTRVFFFFFGGALLRNLNKLVSEDFELKRGMILIHTYSDFFPSLRLARNQVKFYLF